MSSVVERLYTPHEYLAIERSAEYKSEYINGRIFAMSGASRAHNLITLNISGGLHSQLKGRPCETYVSDMRVKVSDTGLYTYPDVTVACAEIELEDQSFDTLLNPRVIIEVLSPSTESYDRGEKFAHYRRLVSLQEYVLIAQHLVRVEHYWREEAHWIFTELNTLDSQLTLSSIDCTLSLRDIYARVLA